MRMIIIVLLFVIGCQKTATQESAHKSSASLDQNGNGVFHNQSSDVFMMFDKMLGLMKRGWQKLKKLIKSEKELPAYCKSILEENPTLADFNKSWQAENEATFCPHDDTGDTCEKKRQQSFAALMVCYQQ